MKEIPLKAVERQNFTIQLDNSLFDITIKECNGIMAATIIRDGIKLVENRRIMASMVLIPEGHLEEGNFAFITPNDNIPYYTNFDSTDVLIYATRAEVEAMRSQSRNVLVGPAPGSIPSGPLVDFDYMAGVLPYGMSLARSSIGTYLINNALKTASSNIPRFESNGLLVENASTNNTTPSEAWGASSGATGSNAYVSTTADANGWIKVTGATDTGRSEGTYRDFANNTQLQNTTSTLSLDVKKIAGYNFRIRAYSGGNGGDGLGNTDGAFKDGQPLPSGSMWNIQDNGDWLRITLTRKFGDGTSIFRIYPFGSETTAAGSLTYRRIQVEKWHVASSYIKTTSAAVTRAADVLTLSQAGPKTVYREYIPLGSTNLVKEVVPFDGIYVPPGNLQKLKVWNRDLTTAEIKALGV